MVRLFSLCVVVALLVPAVYAETGMQFEGNAALGTNESVRFRFIDPHLNGLPIYGTGGQGLTIIWKARPEQQTGFYTTFFYSDDDGTPSFWETNNYFWGAHPYGATSPGSEATTHVWEIAVNQHDYIGAAVENDRWYQQAFVVSGASGSNKEHVFYYDIAGTIGPNINQTITEAGYGDTTTPAPMLSWGDAPWAHMWSWEHEAYKGTIRGVQIYSKRLSEADIMSEIADPLSTVEGAANIWYMNLDPTPTDISDKSGQGNDPSWYGALRPLLYSVSDSCTTVGAGSTELENAAINLAPGEWCELDSSSGLTQSTFQVTSHNVSTQTYKGVWDGVNAEFRWVGQEQGNSATGQNLSLHIKYDDATDAWSKTLASPVGDGEAGHGNDQNAVNPATGDQYRRPYGSNTVLVYDYSGDSWSSIGSSIPGSPPNACSSITWHDARGTLVSVEPERGIHEWNGSSWSTLYSGGSIPNMPSNGICAYSAYDATNARLLFGVEDNGVDYFNALNSNGTLSSLTAPPISIDVFASDTVVVDPVTGDLIAAGTGTTWHYFDAGSDTWQTLTGMPTVGPSGVAGHYTVSAGIPDYGVVGILDCDSNACGNPRFIIYKHASGTADCDDGVDNDGDGMIDLLDPSCANSVDTSENLPGSTFETQCKDANVVRCYSFEDLTDMTTGNPTGTSPSESASRYLEGSGTADCTLQGDTACWDLDTGAVSGVTPTTGKSALRFEYNDQSDGDAAGSVRLNFADDYSTRFGAGEEFYVQYRYRMSPEMLAEAYGSYGFKSIIIGGGDWAGGQTQYSCTDMETVIQTSHPATTPTSGFSGPWMYHSCTAPTPYRRLANYSDATVCGAPANIVNQHVGAPGCCFNAFPGGCWQWAADDWHTVKAHISVGSWNTPLSSRVRMWAAYDGGSETLIFDSDIGGSRSQFAGELVNDATGDHKFGKLWFTPFTTDKTSGHIHATGYVWYDDLLISTTNPAPPEGECGDGTQDAGETCDDGTVAVDDCVYGTPATSQAQVCNANCDGYTTCANESYCGDGTIDSGTGEICDDGEGYPAVVDSCAYGDSPPLTQVCNASCSALVNCTNPLYCGDDSVNGGELCDGTDLASNDCTTLGIGYEGGTLACDVSCAAWDTALCVGWGFSGVKVRGVVVD